MTDKRIQQIDDALLQRVYGEFLEMPGCRLTCKPSGWGIYTRLTEGRAALPRPRMAKAHLDEGFPRKKTEAVNLGRLNLSSSVNTDGRSFMRRALVLGLMLGYAAGCGGSQPADTAMPTPDSGGAPGPATAQEGAQGAPALGGSSITGTVTFAGEAPQLRPVDMAAETVCHEKHGGEPAPNEALVLGSGHTMGNIMVWVSEGLPAGRIWPAPTTPVVLDQDGCVYKPHVMGIMVGQTYRIINSDGILHNIHTLPEINPSLNRGQPATLKEMTTSFPKPEKMFQIKCDVHPWMSAYIGVFAHPFFAVTGTDGRFTISGLDAGTYEVSAWHERLGTQTASLTVAADETKTQDFTFAIPATK